jgi:hypothetical protein
MLKDVQNGKGATLRSFTQAYVTGRSAILRKSASISVDGEPKIAIISAIGEPQTPKRYG